jgi:tripartite-type tricarboxylate transporter receptor subunit TctC
VHKGRKGWIAIVFVLSWTLASVYTEPQAAQAYPTKPIRIIVLSMAGTGQDIVARLIGSKLTEAWGQQVIVDNRAGATGIIGAEIGARAAPDGYTIVIATSQIVIVSAMYPNLKFDLLNDFTPVSLLASTPNIMVVNPSVAATTVDELVALAKTKPGQLHYGSGGAGSPVHLAGEIFKWMTGTDIVHVPYKASSLALTDTVGGQIQLTLVVAPMVLQVIKAGKVRALGVTSLKRTRLAPEIPAIAESVPGYEFTSWYSLVTPAKTPHDIIEKLNREVVRALRAPEFQERFTAIGAEVIGSTPGELGTYLRTETEKMRKAIKATGAHPE